MRKRKMKSGIQAKYLKYMISLLLLALFLSSVGVWGYVQRNMTAVIVDKYEFMNEKMGLALDELYQKMDAVTADCIMDDNVQKSLRNRNLAMTEKMALSKYFSYIDLEHVAEYCYVDNKKNVYTKSYSKITYQDFEESGFADMLGDDYAKTQWFWAEDTLCGKGGRSLFVGRYVHSMDYDHEPGMLFLKMNAAVFYDFVEDRGKMEDEIAVGITAADGSVCMSWCPQNYVFPEQVSERVKELAASSESGMILQAEKIRGGVLSAYRQKDSGLIIFTLVPNEVLTSGLGQIFAVMVVIYLLVIAVAVVVSVFLSRIFTRPIRQITETMTSFDGKDFSKTIELHTNTELDQIGHSYNEMLGNIEQQLQEIKDQQNELRTSELNMLINQTNPHFLYNTLDTIYMLARINGEETTMRMIQALSKYLRLSLSKGSDTVTVEDELENVRSYMEIQQIRNENLFRYEIQSEVDTRKRWVMKLILQPLVENAVKYGFCDIFEGGLIRIRVWEEEGRLSFSVYNNGTPIQREVADQINALGKFPISEMKNCFPDKKHGYGVVNIITRLRLKYGEDVELIYEVHQEGTQVLIRLPVDGTQETES